MRILIDVPKPDLELMDEAVSKLTISRAEFVRRAIATSLTPYRRKMNHSSFGSWPGRTRSKSGHGDDGLVYQKKMRAEW